MNILRRISLSRLLLACGLVVAVGVSATAIASALDSGPTPGPKPLAQAVHDALAAPAVPGVSASIQLSDHLLEGANLATGGQGGELTSSPLITGASGRLWVGGDGHARLELQSEKGDTQILWDGNTLELYDAATNTLYRYTPPARSQGSDTSDGHHEPPSLAQIEEGISKLQGHADVLGATPTDVAGQPAYTVGLAPKEAGSLFGRVELSFDADNGVPLRGAVYSSTSSSPVIELAASEVSFEAVPASVLAFTPPAGAKVVEIKAPSESGSSQPASETDRPKITTHGHGASTIVLLEETVKAGDEGSATEGLPQVKLGSVNASELSTELGTVLSFERSGVRYIVGASLAPEAVEAFARGL